MAKVACDKVGRDDEVADFATASFAGISRLDPSVCGLERAIAKLSVEAVEDAAPVSFWGKGVLLEGLHLVAERPSAPRGKLLFGLGSCGRCCEVVAQGFLQAERPAGLEM